MIGPQVNKNTKIMDARLSRMESARFSEPSHFNRDLQLLTLYDEKMLKVVEASMSLQIC